MGALSWLSALVEWFGQFFPRFAQVTCMDRGVRMRLGRPAVEVKPGFVWWWPVIERVHLVPVTPTVVDLKGQVVTTKDGVSVALSGWLLYEITDVVTHLTRVTNADGSIETVALKCARQAASESTWNAHVEDPGLVNDAMLEALEGAQHQFGVRVIDCGLTDFAKTRCLSLLGDSALVKFTN